MLTTTESELLDRVLEPGVHLHKDDCAAVRTIIARLEAERDDFREKRDLILTAHDCLKAQLVEQVRLAGESAAVLMRERDHAESAFQEIKKGHDLAVRDWQESHNFNKYWKGRAEKNEQALAAKSREIEALRSLLERVLYGDSFTSAEVNSLLAKTPEQGGSDG